MSQPISESYQQFEDLMRKSLKEPAPKVDAVAKVMLRIQTVGVVRRNQEPILDQALLSICGLSLTLAIVMVMLTVDQLWLLNDPLSGLFEPMGIALR